MLKDGEIDYLIEIRGVYDGWSIAVLKDGTLWNRWANDEQTEAYPGYKRRYEATRKCIEEMQAERNGHVEPS